MDEQLKQLFPKPPDDPSKSLKSKAVAIDIGEFLVPPADYLGKPEPPPESTPTPAIEEPTDSLEPAPNPEPKATPAPRRKKPLNVWLAVTLVLLALFTLPFLPGKVLGSSNAVGSNSLATTASQSCSGVSIPIQTTGPYQGKQGFPITYSYHQTVSSSVQCNGITKALGTRTVSTFNFLGVMTDILLSGVLAFLGLILVNVFRKRIAKGKQTD